MRSIEPDSTNATAATEFTLETIVLTGIAPNAAISATNYDWIISRSVHQGPGRGVEEASVLIRNILHAGPEGPAISVPELGEGKSCF